MIIIAIMKKIAGINHISTGPNRKLMPQAYRRAILACSIKAIVIVLGAAAQFTFAPNACAAGGDLFVSDLSTNSIIAYSPDGTPRTFASGLDSPQGLAFDHTGNLYEADFGSGNIYEFTADGTKSTFLSGLSGPIGIAFDASGNLLIAENTIDQINSFAVDGKEDLFATVTAPTALTFDNPFLFVANADSVVKFDGPGA